MSRRLTRLFACCAVAMLGIVGRADALAFDLVPDGGAKRLDSTNDQFRAHLRWSHGAYFFADRVTGQPPIFYTVDRDGSLLNSTRFEYSGDGVLYPGSFDRMSDGTFVFAGMTENSPRVVSPFLAWTSADGRVQHMSRTGKYLIYALAVAPDDTIWTLGYEADTTSRDWQTDRSANVLRQFDGSGRMLQSALPLSEFERLQGLKGFANGQLAVSRDRIGWYRSIGGKANYLEISQKDFSVKTYPGVSAHPDQFEFPVALAITDDGVVSVAIQHRPPSHQAAYILNAQSESWTTAEVPHFGTSSYPPYLIGSDNRDLVFVAGHESAFFKLSGPNSVSLP